MKHAALLATIASAFLASSGAGAHEDERIPDGAPDRVGEVTFPISCNAAAQQEFNRALAMLHSFFYPEAGKTFARVTELDPSCAMGYWGVAMSWWYPLWYPPTKDSLKQGKAAVDKALAMDAKTQRERTYIVAIATFYDQVEQRDHKTRAAAYEKAMAGVHAAFPDDREPRCCMRWPSRRRPTRMTRPTPSSSRAQRSWNRYSPNNPTIPALRTI